MLVTRDTCPNLRDRTQAGSDRGGATAAVLFSLTSSCQRHGVDPFAYLRDVLARLPDQSPERLEELLPDRWAEPPKAASAS